MTVIIKDNFRHYPGERNVSVMDSHDKMKVKVKAVNCMENLSIRQINGLARRVLGRTNRIVSVNVYTEM